MTLRVTLPAVSCTEPFAFCTAPLASRLRFLVALPTAFYTTVGDAFPVVQLTPPGSACSIAPGTGITDAAPGSIRGTHLVVNDIEAARAQLLQRGVEVSEIRHLESGQWTPGPHPERLDYQSFADFSDPDGNTWVLQEWHGDSPPR